MFLLNPEDFKNEFTAEINSIDKLAIKVLSKILYNIVDEVEIEKKYSDEDNVILEIKKADPGIIIGKHGHTLDAIQYLVNMVASREKKQSAENKLYIIDIDGYRKRRFDSLQRYAHEKANIVKRNNNPISLYFMNSVERRIIHLALKEDSDVITSSEGKEPFRRVIISPVKRNNNGLVDV
ncbi:MAG: KH domain-containing protein [Atribacterota bacterium]|nr:KH domain-containing protein [Atribacterota bacterium]